MDKFLKCLHLNGSYTPVNKLNYLICYLSFSLEKWFQIYVEKYYNYIAENKILKIDIKITIYYLPKYLR